MAKNFKLTPLNMSIISLIPYAHHLGLTLSSCRYTRVSFIFPKSQPFPHTSFKDEVTYLQDTIPSNLCFRKASIMPSKSSSHSWHVFTTNDSTHALPHLSYDHHNELLFTMEICMTELDPILALKFFRPPEDGKSSDSAGKEMTELTGINKINPDALMYDFAFDPCRYSMNGMDGDWYSTIHVTLEDDFSYASFEWVGSINKKKELFYGPVGKILMKIVRPEYSSPM
ncbi:S-adenosylmethionine decarboxylase proenzyme 4-like [Vigna angularis]|uniref:S-adenosylmethionine decarboxylase proenzyme 4-like n=1 Tax=Phaseolus angularis TaxID=3914 RepID=UPI00080A6E1F|nr:S-adenosylmethionine decarboxylase proenzyme 4-like [Vigna angularis]